MRKLNSFNVCDTILCNFYHSFIESLLTFSFICWFNGLSVKEKNSLNTIVKVCSNIYYTVPKSKSNRYASLFFYLRTNS